MARRKISIALIAFSVAPLSIVTGCGGDDSKSELPVDVGATAGVAPSVAGAPALVQPTQTPSMTTNMPTAPITPPASPVAGSAAGAAGAAAPPGHSEHGGAAGGMSPMMAAAAMQCKLHAEPDPRDEMLTDAPLEMTVGVTKDLLVPQIVLDWMDERQFAESHDGWHLVRKWDQSCRKSNATTCSGVTRLMQQGLTRASIQQGAPGDGVAFMMMHRHMIMMLKTAFPKHTKLFDGFTKVPRAQADAENPAPWKAISWTSNNITGFDLLENIEKNVAQFPTEDDLGQFIENTYKWTATTPMSPLNTPGSGLHGALHGQWSVNGSPANLIQQSVDVKNYTFWKLHGWIDNVWERYRKAKGLKDDDPAYQKLMFDQCMEMFTLQPRNRGMSPTTSPGTGAAGSGATVPETGVFAQNVRPFLDSTCAGCHSAIAPSAGMTLGGSGISSAEILDGLISQKASNGEYNLIEPGMPQKSWVYLKASGDVATVTCTAACDREPMPPSGVGLNAAQLTTLRDWIMSGAPRM